MDKDSDSKNWFQTLPGILTGVAAVVGAVTTLIVALLGGKGVLPEGLKTEPPPTATKQKNVKPRPVDDCIPPYVWRLAVPSDHICVTADSRKQVELESQRASERRQ